MVSLEIFVNRKGFWWLVFPYFISLSNSNLDGQSLLNYHQNTDYKTLAKCAFFCYIPMLEKNNSISSILEICLYLSFNERKDFCSWFIRKPVVYRIRSLASPGKREWGRRKNYTERSVHEYFQISACCSQRKLWRKDKVQWEDSKPKGMSRWTQIKARSEFITNLHQILNETFLTFS